ncbi:Sec-independent protein translocase subunit TatB [Thalassotalea euphylliae]|uniref:Sec-independent protein translocase protein TatB n=1 Tax=Thalassotalea euphylliae TaxID=1655234 RepID=A0A3E0TXU6_9GAMM|nr:Sec-independent protein translocase protein TatB [Thalassotalea euphylliae]REL28702.1 Sec-independent protein translocase subunit TatB [Thalassotalea euphylliae]
MFDIGFWELMLIAVIGLLVLGPERLPVAIRTVRDWVNGVRQFSQSVKTELKEELRINELHENLKKAEQSDFKNMSPQVAESLKSLQEAADMVNRPYQQQSPDFDSSTGQPELSAQVAQTQQDLRSSEQVKQNPAQEALTGASPTIQENSTPNDKQSG